MPYTTPKYGLQVPSPTTKMNELGVELQQMGISIEAVLESFDYNGADPNLVLARVAALEAWRTSAAAQLATLTAATPWTTVSLAPGFTGEVKWRQIGYFIDFRFDISGSFPTGDAAYTQAIPAEVRPSTVGGGIIAIEAYIDPAGARETGRVYFSSAAGVLRGTSAGSSTSFTRVRGVANWLKD